MTNDATESTTTPEAMSPDESAEPKLEQPAEETPAAAATPADDGAMPADDSDAPDVATPEATESFEQPSRIKIGSKREENAAVEIKAKPQSLEKGLGVKDHAEADLAGKTRVEVPAGGRGRLSPKLEAEIAAALGGASIDEIMAAGETATTQAATELEADSKTKGRVLSIRGESVFLDLGTRHEGVVSIKQFKSPPKKGAQCDVVIKQFNAEEGLYDCLLPGATAAVSGWSELAEGIVVDVVITGSNTGGLECKVSQIRGFIPASHIALYRVENLNEYIGKKLSCVVTKLKPGKDLVLSHRAVLERERQEARDQLLGQLEVGQEREGVVRRLQPFGAFVDIGGIDGLVHISQMSWDRIAHPSEVLSEGQKIKVKISKIDPQTGKIGLAYRELWESPWKNVEEKYRPKSTVTGTVSKLTDFGAFVRLEPGVEGLIHISELAHRRVARSAEIVREGQEVEVMVLAVDPDKQRISLSLKELEPRPEPAARPETKHASDAANQEGPRPSKKKRDPNLKGGFDHKSGGQEFGLKW